MMSDTSMSIEILSNIMPDKPQDSGPKKLVAIYRSKRLDAACMAREPDVPSIFFQDHLFLVLSKS